MISINMRDNIKQVERELNDLARKQMPFATALALTRTGKAVEKALQKDMTSTFDSPAPWIAKGTFTKPATKQAPTAEVGMRDMGARNPAKYVQEHFAGGERGQKPYERALQRMGILPAGMKAIPGEAMKLDRYGNPSRAVIAEVLGALRSGWRSYQGKGKRQALVGYFVVLPGSSVPRTAHLAPGVWRRVQRAGQSAVVPVFAFVDEASYQKVIDLPKITGETVRREFDGHMTASIEQATRTAR